MATDSHKRECRPLAAGGRGKAGQSAWRGGLSTPHYSTQHQNRKTVRHGRIEGGVWRKTVRASVHQLRRPPSWAVDVDDLEAAEAAGVTTLEIHDTEADVIWAAPLSKFHEFGVEISRGYGSQIALPLPHWSRRKVGEPAEVSRQLALFGAGEVAP